MNNLIKLNPQIGDKFIPKTVLERFEDIKDKPWTIIKLLDKTGATYNSKRAKSICYVAEYKGHRALYDDNDIKEWV